MVQSVAPNNDFALNHVRIIPNIRLSNIYLFRNECPLATPRPSHEGNTLQNLLRRPEKCLVGQHVGQLLVERRIELFQQ